MENWHWEADTCRLILALAIGAIIGAEREYRSKSAGLRTMILICVSAALFTLLSEHINPSNPDRIAANIITGIGFLGAGIIYKTENGVSGLTTASSIWIVAGLGMTAGAGYLQLAIIATAIVIVVLTGLFFVQNKIDHLNQMRHYQITCNYEQQTLHHYEQIFAQCHLSVTRGKQSKNEHFIVGNWQLRGSVANHEKLIKLLLTDSKIKAFDF